MKYTGVIIEESLQNKQLPKGITILSTKVEVVTPKHKTPWLTRWTLHSISISEEYAQQIAEQLSNQMETEHPWYADFKNDSNHYIIFREKVFRVNRTGDKEYESVKTYGISLGIPDYQLEFPPEQP
jgi:hypothetical protein